MSKLAHSNDANMLRLDINRAFDECDEEFIARHIEEQEAEIAKLRQLLLRMRALVMAATAELAREAAENASKEFDAGKERSNAAES